MASLSATRASLLVRVRDLGDQAAWSEFVRIYAPLIHAYGLHRGLQDADAADLAQEVIRRVARSVPEFRYDPALGSFRGWLYTVTRNELLKLVERNRRGAAGSGDSGVQQLLQQQIDPAADAAAWDQEHERSLLRRALERVRPEFRAATWQAFLRTAIEGDSAPDVARRLGISVGAVYIARSRVTARLREEIAALGEAEAMALAECPGDDALRQLLAAGEAPGDLEEHLSHCSACQARLDALLSAATESGLLRRSADEQPSSALAAAMQALEAESPAPGFSVGQRGGAAFPFLEPPDRPELLGKLGPYEIRRVLGRGGMGVVFLAEDIRLRRPVAIKALAPLSALSDESRGRFLREAQTAAALNHENVVQVYGVEQAGEVPCLVLQYVAGESLADRLARVGKLPLAELIDLGRDVARGLAAAHAARLIHRDIKPANILLDERTGRALIADFGLAKPLDEAALTSSGLIVGTPEFIAPEQLDGGPVDERSDLFGLGATLYLAATGVSPFRAASPWAAIDRVRRHEPAAANTLNPALPTWLSDLIVRLLEKDPQTRLSSAAEVLRRFEAAAPTTVVERADAATVVGLERPQPGRLTARRSAFAVVALAALLIVGWRLWPRESTPAPALRPATADGFYLSGRAQPLADLADAIAQAPDGATIEIRGDGPFRCVPLATGAKRLTVRAATGSRPMIIMDSPGQPSERPWLQSDADLTLAGLDIRWTTAGAAGRGEAELLGRSVVATTRGKLRLSHCRIVSGRLNCCVGAAGDLSLEACHLAAENGVGVFWRPTAGARCEIIGTAFDTWLAITSMTSAEIANPAPARLVLSNNTFRGARGFQFILEPPPRQPIDVQATGNVFALEALAVLVPQRRPRRPEAGLTGEQAKTQFRACLTAWSGRDNVYRRGLEFVTYAPTPRPTPLSAGVGDLAQWAEVWDGTRESSIEGTPRFAAPPGEGNFAAPRLERIDDPSGPIPAAGAPAEQVGPG